MKKQTKCALCAALIFTILSMLFVVVLKFVDVQPIGPEDTEVGLATFNGLVRDYLGTDDIWLAVADILGIVAFITIGILALYGLCQWIKRKNMFKVDSVILAAGLMFLVVGALYIAFDRFIVINFRPVYQNGELESSFPSSHTMMAIAVYGAGIAALSSMVPDSGLRWFPRIVLGVFLVLQVVARTLSGYHWATDIIGAVLISAALFGWFETVRYLIDTAKEKKEVKNEL